MAKHSSSNPDILSRRKAPATNHVATPASHHDVAKCDIKSNITLHWHLNYERVPQPANMALQPLSVGDILMLSQTAWRIGRAFSHGQRSAPAEFARVERCASDLSHALKLAADSLHADDSILSDADSETAEAVWAILESAEKSLSDLESFLERYQDIRRRETEGGYIVERSWSKAVLANYKKLKWTSEGGNIDQLQDLLRMHTNTVNLTMQALQTQSLTRLERTVVPIAKNVASLHERVAGDLGCKIDDMHQVIMAVANSTPSLQASDREFYSGVQRQRVSSGSLVQNPLLLDSSTTSTPTDGRNSVASRRHDSTMSSTVAADMFLPSPELTPDRRPAATPLNLFASNERARAERVAEPSHSTHRNNTAEVESAFGRSIFRNATILCDAQVKLVEYTRQIVEVTDLRYETEMTRLCDQARICVVRRLEDVEHDSNKTSTSVWMISQDGSLRCQYRLPDFKEMIPHCSFFEAEKISLAGTSAEKLTLRTFKTERNGLSETEVRTGWVNYVFVSAKGATDFQSAIYGRSLIGSFQTTKTTVPHSGVRGMFAFEEQFAKMDRLRLWEDDGTAVAGAAGGVMALTHVSSTYGEGWAKWWVNSSRQQVTIKRDGEKCVKIQNLEMTIPGSIPAPLGPARRPSVLEEHVVGARMARAVVKRVTGMRIEFPDTRERNEFLALAQRIRERMLPLPCL